MPNLLVTRWAAAAPKAEQRLEGSPRFPATVGPEDELIEVDLELPTADSGCVTALGTSKALWPAARGPVVCARLLAGELLLKLPEALRERRHGHPETLPIGVC